MRASTRRNLISNIKKDLSHIYQEKSRALEKSKLEVILTIFYILLIFVGIRLLRILIASEVISQEYISFSLLKTYPELLFLGLLLFTFLLIFSGRAIKLAFYNEISKFVGISENQGKIYFLVSACTLFFTFLVYEYLKSPEKIGPEIIKIMTFYLILFVFVKLLIYMYKKSFLEANIILKDINTLKSGDIVDYSYLIKKWGKNEEIGFVSFDERETKKNTGILSPDPRDFFKSLKGGVDSEQINILKKTYKVLGEKEIPVCSVFSYGVYVLLGFTITIIWENNILSFIVSQGLELFFSH